MRLPVIALCVAAYAIASFALLVTVNAATGDRNGYAYAFAHGHRCYALLGRLCTRDPHPYR